jgi:hypothetical protein
MPGAQGGGVAPLANFCCGCELSFAVKLVVTWSALSSAFYICSAWINIVMEVDGVGHNIPLWTQTFNCFYALASTPFIVCGYWGLRDGAETHLRIFLAWLSGTFTLDTIFLGMLFFKNACARIPAMLQEQGASWSCGMMRAASITLLVLLMAMQGYLCFATWSYCEQLRRKGSKHVFDDMLGAAYLAERSKPFIAKVGLFGTGQGKKDPYPMCYGSLQSKLFAGNASLFGGTEHEINYPPLAKD